MLAVDRIFFRYIVNGILATLVHYSVLFFLVEIIEFKSVGFSNLLASFFGISASFIGNKIFVFNNSNGKLPNQLTSYISLYFSIALMHGLFLYLWTDLYNMDYRIGFIIVTVVQVSLSYAGNKKIVFK